MSFETWLSKRFRKSLRNKVTLVVFVPLVIILGLFNIIEYRDHQETLLNTLSFLAAETGQVIENSLEHEMLARNISGMQEMLNAVGKNEDIQALYLLNSTGQVIFAPERKNVGVQMDKHDPTCQPCHRLSSQERPSSIVVSLPDGQKIFRSMNPIENKPECHSCHESTQRNNGLLLIDFSIAPFVETIQADLRENLLWGIVSIITVLVVINLALSRFVLQRLEGFAQAMSKFGQGSFNFRLSQNDSDEIGQLARAFNEMGNSLENEANQNHILWKKIRQQSEQRGKLLKGLIFAQENERKRVARELHDELGQALGGMGLHLEVMGRFLHSDPELAMEYLETTRGLVSETSDRMYDLILALRPSVLDDLGLIVAVNAHAEMLFANGKVEFELKVSNLDARLPTDIETVLYRILQEALSNIAKHSQASRVTVSMSCENGLFVGKIIDNGKGFDLETFQQDAEGRGGWGLLGIRERVTQIDGEVEISSKPGHGFEIIFQIPICGEPE